jgi:hypothetical protein
MIEVTAGLQISHPLPLPWLASSASKVLIWLILTIWNSSHGVKAKCSHRCLTTRPRPPAQQQIGDHGMQPPQPVPALRRLSPADGRQALLADRLAELAFADVVARAD